MKTCLASMDASKGPLSNGTSLNPVRPNSDSDLCEKMLKNETIDLY